MSKSDALQTNFGVDSVIVYRFDPAGEIKIAFT